MDTVCGVPSVFTHSTSIVKAIFGHCRLDASRAALSRGDIDSQCDILFAVIAAVRRRHKDISRTTGTEVGSQADARVLSVGKKHHRVYLPMLTTQTVFVHNETNSSENETYRRTSSLLAASTILFTMKPTVLANKIDGHTSSQLAASIVLVCMQ